MNHVLSPAKGKMWMRNFMLWIIGTPYYKAVQLLLMPSYSAIVTCMGYSRRLSPRNSHLWLLNGKMYLSRQHKGKYVYSQHRDVCHSPILWIVPIYSHTQWTEPREHRVCLCPMSINTWASGRIKICACEALC